MSLIDLMVKDGATGLWLLDEPSGATAKNQKSTGDATLTGAYTRNQAGLLVGDPRPSTSFSGGYADIADNAAFSSHAGASGQMSVETVFSTDDLTAQRYLFTKASNPYEFALFVQDTAGLVTFKTWSDVGATVMTVNSASGTSISTKYHVLATIDRAAPLISIYLNGVAASNSTLPNGAIYSSDTTSALSIGRRGDNSPSPMSGKIGPVAYYPTALTAAQAGAHYREWLRGGVSY